MEIILEAGRTERNYWRDLWRYRDLFRMLAWRDVSVRYKQTVLGLAWAIVRPVLTAAIFTFVFGRIARLPTDGAAPYIVMVFAGLLPWTFFSTAIADAANSLIGNTNLISKVYFPRLIVPAASMGVALTDFVVGLGILAVLMGGYRFAPDWRILFLPAFAVLGVLSALGPGLWITALNVKYRDFRHAVPFFVQLGLYVSPVGFSSSIVPSQWRWLYSLNPVVAVIDGFRWSLLRGERPIYWPGLALGVLTTAVLLVAGIRQFRRVEKTFADVI